MSNNGSYRGLGGVSLLALALSLLMGAGLAGLAVAGGSEDDPALEPAESAPPAASSEQAAGQEVEAWLDRIEEKSNQVKTLTAQIRYDREQGLLGDQQRRFGKVLFDAGPPARFAIHFDRLLVDGSLRPQNRWYIFDGVWLVERQEDQKQFFKRQVVPPDAPADQSNPLALGRGPFLLPVNAKKQQILKRFEVKLVPEEDAKLVRLQLTPREVLDDEFAQVDLWYNRKTLLPTRARTLDDSQNVSTITLTDVQVNVELPEQAFAVEEPTEAGWRVEITPWQE